jgi:hypothetical protein
MLIDNNISKAIETIISDYFPGRKYDFNQIGNILYVLLESSENFNNMENYTNDIKFIIIESKNASDIDKLLKININRYKSKNIINYILLLLIILLIIYILIKYVIN